MKLHELKPNKGTVKKRKRLGRGTGTGQGKTAGRGQDGQNSRSGGGTRPGFEGGQMPLQRRVPKFGFTSPNRVEYKAINLDTLQDLAEKTKAEHIDPALLAANGLAGKNDLIKILGRGALTSKVDVTAHKFSTSATVAIEKAGGTATKL